MKRMRWTNDQRKDKQRVWSEHLCRWCMSEDLAVQEDVGRVSAPRRQSKESWYHQKYRKTTRNSIEDMEISQLEVKSDVREVQGVSLDADKRDLQRLASKQVEASDALIDEFGALLTESGGAQIIEAVTPRPFRKAGDLGLRPGFAIDLCGNKRMNHMKVSVGISARTAT